MPETKFNNYKKFQSDLMDGTIPLEVSGIPVHMNAYGAELLSYMCLDLYGLPIRIDGTSGMGKTILGKAAACVFSSNVYQTNGTRSTTTEELLGSHFPVTKEMPDGSWHNALSWHEQAAYLALTQGGVFLFDEFNVVDVEIQTMMHSWLETSHATFSVPQLGIHSQPVHEDFWFIGTGNPQGGGYAASNVGAALKDRLYDLTEEPIDQPLADETKMLKDILVTEKDDRSEFIGPLVNWVNELRNDKTNTNVCTRDLAKAATLISRGKPPVPSIEMACAGGLYPDGYRVIVDNAKLHFGKDRKVTPKDGMVEREAASRERVTTGTDTTTAKMIWDK